MQQFSITAEIPFAPRGLLWIPHALSHGNLETKFRGLWVSPLWVSPVDG
jgi:hypothetical protein